MKNIIKSMLTLMIIIIVSCVSQSQSDRINKYMSTLEESGFSGSLLVASDGQVIHKKGYGMANQTKGIIVTPSTVFTIGSITKQFTGAAILKLEMMGKLKVTDLIGKYIDNVPEDKRMITIHHLLTHSAGFSGAIGRDNELTGAKDFLFKAFSHELLFPPGSKYHYSNVGYSILGIIIEKVSGMTYESFLEKHLFMPAGMKSTGYVLPKYNLDNVAIGYHRSGEKWGKVIEKNWGEEGPGWHLKANGGIHSTVEDMYLWHKAILGEEILSASAKEKWYKRHIAEGEGATTFYGYGWAIFPTPRNTDLITHNGGNGIFFADFWRYLTEDITIIVMTNKAERRFENVASNIAGILLNPDFEPRIIEDKGDGNEEDEAMIESLALTFFEVVAQEDKSVWEEFIKTRTTIEFQKMADMNFHLEMFSQMHEKLAGQQPEEAELENDEVVIIMSNGTEVVLGFEQDEKGKLLIGGIGVN